jgi:TPR repeat protein
MSTLLLSGSPSMPLAPLRQPAMMDLSGGGCGRGDAMFRRDRFGAAGCWLLALVCCAAAPGAARAEPLGINAAQAIAAATGNGLLSPGDFQPVDDPYVGPLVVGRMAPPAEGATPEAALSVVLYGGGDDVEQIQVNMTPPWKGLADEAELIGSILRALKLDLPDPPSAVASNARFGKLSREAQWTIGLLSEAWAGWPGTPSRQVRVRDGVALIFEGTPPDDWVVTIVRDKGYADVNWPGPDPQGEVDAVRQARLLIRQGDYQQAHDLLHVTALQDDPAAQTLLGDMWRFARIGHTDQQIATNFYLRAGRTKYPEAVYELATMSNSGYGVLTLDGIRLPLLDTAAQKGNADALFMLSAQKDNVFYMRPQGVTPFDQAHAAGLMGLLAAQVDVANRYARGDGVGADPVEAYAWALLAVSDTDPGIDWIRNRKLADDLKQKLDADQVAEAQRRAKVLAQQVKDDHIEVPTGPPA